MDSSDAKAVEAEDAYSAILKAELSPILGVILKLVHDKQPEDPVSFLATHLRHLKTEGGQLLQIVNCSTCSPALQKSMDKDHLVEALKQDERSMDNLKNCDITELWPELLGKYGENLRWWHIASAIHYLNSGSNQQKFQRSSKFIVYIFISSTFSDMHDERDFLVNHVMPELQQWCDECGLRLQIKPIDLRWGVASDRSFEICMNLINLCREQNGMPYFLGLVGQRYGWVPEPDKLPSYVRREYSYIPGLSVTGAEILNGAIWQNNRNAVVLFRKTDVTQFARSCAIEAADQAALLKVYGTELAEDMHSLQKLEEIVRTSMPSQCFDYTCKISNEITTVKNEKKLNLSNFECSNGISLRKCVVDFFKTQIQQQYPPTAANKESNSLIQAQKSYHHAFARDHVYPTFGRETEVAAIRAYIDQPNAEGVSNEILVVEGPPGVGKSSLLATIASMYLGENFAAIGKAEEYKVFLHFVGVEPSSTSLSSLIRRMWFHLLDYPEQKIPSDIAELRLSLQKVLQQASEKLNSEFKLLLFIDAVNQLDDENEALQLTWLPKVVPNNVRLIVSFATTAGNPTTISKTLGALSNKVSVQSFTKENRCRVIKSYFENYGRSLSDEQLNVILGKEDSGLPLWLTFACEELRRFGKFNLLNEKIQSLGSDLEGIILQAVERALNARSDLKNMIEAALSLIATSRFGLTEEEMCRLLSVEPKQTTAPPQCATTLPFQYTRIGETTWQDVYLELRPYLRPVRILNGRLDFYHRAISKVISRRFLGDVEVRNTWHVRLADYFEFHCADKQRQALELPAHLLALGLHERLQNCFLDPFIFEQLDCDENKLFFVRSWLTATGNSYQAIVKAYARAIYSTWVHLIAPENTIRPEILIVDDAEQLIVVLKNLTGSNLDKWLELTVRCSRFFVDLRAYAFAAIGFSQDFNAMSKAIADFAKLTYSIFVEILETRPDQTRLGELIAACWRPLQEHVNKAIEIMQAKNDKGNLSTLYLAKGYEMRDNGREDGVVLYFSKALQYGYEEFGKFHSSTAEIHRLFGESLRDVADFAGAEKSSPTYEASLKNFETELEIREAVVGASHPHTLRACNNCIRLLNYLNRSSEVSRLSERYPGWQSVHT